MKCGGSQKRIIENTVLELPDVPYNNNKSECGTKKRRHVKSAKMPLSRKGRSMQRKVAYVFLYKNGIRERSVGIVKRYGTAEQPEVALELFGEEERKKRWRIYYFTEGEALVEAAYLWGCTTERGKSEARLSQCRICAEAGMGGGIVLLPEREVEPERNSRENRMEQSDINNNRTRSGAVLREYLCARYDGKEITEEVLREAFLRKPEPFCDPRIESAKKLMEEIAKAAGGEIEEETAASVHSETLAGIDEEDIRSRYSEEGENGEWNRRQDSDSKPRKKKRTGGQIAYLEKLLLLNPPYGPCRRFDVEYSVRVTPEELLNFPKEGKRFAENSFVLHAYYRYRHVLLGRRRRKTAEDYVLLVPGSYNEKEAKLAELFGFPEFLPVKAIARSEPEVREKMCAEEQKLRRKIGEEKIPETGNGASGKELFGYFCGKI